MTLGYERALAELAVAVTRKRGREICLDDGRGEARVYIGSVLHMDVPQLKAGDSLRAVGVVRRFEVEGNVFCGRFCSCSYALRGYGAHGRLKIPAASLR
jgi:hypothetical protein